MVNCGENILSGNFPIFQLVNNVKSRQMAAEILFGPRPKAEGRNGSRLPFACLRQLFINENIQNYANFSFFLFVFHNVTGEQLNSMLF